MMNFTSQMPPTAAVLSIPQAHLHDYGKSPRPGRKLGHATVVAATAEDRDLALQRLTELESA